MSSDLWAAFGSPSDTPAPPEPRRSPGQDDDAHSDADSWSAVNDELQSAWFGDAQGKQAPPAGPPPAQATPLNLDARPPAGEDDDFGDFEEPERDGHGEDRPGDAGSLEQSGVLVPAAGDAGADSDDFGDFEDVQPAEQKAPAAQEASASAARPSQRPAASTQRQSTGFGSLIDLDDSGPFTAAAAPPAKKQPAREIPVLVAADDGDSYHDDDAWDDFGSAEPSTAARPAAPEPFRGPPPTNIPPPSILLSALVAHMERLPEQIRVTIVETWEDGEADVQKHVDVLAVAARVAAGRKLRWKRDTILAQSMRMGAAGAGSGMKLAGVDRAQAAREHREAAELVRAWRESAGAIRTALAEAGGKKKALPQIAENAAVRAGRPEEGAIAAPKACVLCGLKRDERVDRVDSEVWDQFGEWWTEHWGHAACRAVWEELQPTLLQR